MLAWLWTRLSKGGPLTSVSGRALRRFPEPEVDRLLRARVLVEHGKADYWSVCARCDCGLDMRPIRKVSGTLRACCPHDAAEDVVLEEDDLRRFEIAPVHLARQIAVSGGLVGKATQIEEGLWLLGRTSTEQCIFLCRDPEILMTTGAVLSVKAGAAAAPAMIVVDDVDPAMAVKLAASGLTAISLGDCVRTDGSGSQRLDFGLATCAAPQARLLLNIPNRMAVLDGREITLAEQSFTLLRCLSEAARNGRSLVETRDLEDLIWGRGIHRVQSTIRDPIRALRDALAKGAPDPGAIRGLIKSRRNPNGYQLALAATEIRLTD